MSALKQYMGHSSITVTTGTYVEVIERVQHDAVNKLAGLFNQEGDEEDGFE